LREAEKLAERETPTPVSQTSRRTRRNDIKVAEIAIYAQLSGCRIWNSR